MLKGIHIERELSYNAPTTITQLLRVDVTAKKIVQRVTVPDATDMTTGWQGYVAVGGPDAIGILTTASLEVCRIVLICSLIPCPCGVCVVTSRLNYCHRM